MKIIFCTFLKGTQYIRMVSKCKCLESKTWVVDLYDFLIDLTKNNFN